MSKRYPRQISYPSDLSRWEDAAGVVHYVGTHTDTKVFTECGYVIAYSQSYNHTSLQQLYDVTEKPTTCIRCASEDL